MEQQDFNQDAFMASIRDQLGEGSQQTVDLDRFSPVILGAEPDKGFVDSVRDTDVIEPVICYVDEHLEILRLLDGQRRVKAARLAGKKQIKAVVYPPSAMQTWATLSVLLNERRSANPVTEFEAIRDLQKRGLTLGQIVRVTGMSLGTVKRRMQLAKLDERVVEMARSGKISPGVLEATAKLPADEQHVIADQIAAGEKVTHAKIDEVRSVARHEHLQGLPGDIFEAPAKDPVAGIRKALDAARAHANDFENPAVQDFVRANIDNLERAIEGELRRRKDQAMAALQTAVENRIRGEEVDGAEVDRAGVAGPVDAEDHAVGKLKPGQRHPKSFSVDDKVRIVRGELKGVEGEAIAISPDGGVTVATKDGRYVYRPNTLVKID